MRVACSWGSPPGAYNRDQAGGMGRGRGLWLLPWAGQRGREAEPLRGTSSPSAGSATSSHRSQPDGQSHAGSLALPVRGAGLGYRRRALPSRFSADGQGPAVAPRRCPVAGGGVAPPGIASPGSLLPGALPGTRKRKRRRGRGPATRQLWAGALPGGNLGVSGVGALCRLTGRGSSPARQPNASHARAWPHLAHHFLFSFLHC